MNNMVLTNAQYMADFNGNNNSITVDIDGQTMSVPLAPDNIHYAEILKQVEAGTITIAAAD